MRHGRRLVFTALLLALLPANAGAAVTFGSDLSREPLNGYGCWLGGTFTQTGFELRSAAAPQDGVIVRWRMRAGSGGSAPLRVVRKAADGTFIGIATSAPGVIDTEGYDWADRTRTYPTRLPIKRGDYLGIDVPVGGEIVTAFGRLDAQVMWTGVPGSELRSFDPRLRDGEARFPGQTVNCFDGGSGADLELLVNADIERDADNDGFGDETQDGCPQDAQRQGPPCGESAPAPAPAPDPPPAPASASPPPPSDQPASQGGLAGARDQSPPAGRRDARLRVRRARMRHGRIHMSGTIARGCRGRLTVRAAGSVRIRIDGARTRWSASVRSAHARHASVAYRGDCAAERVRVTAARR